MTLPMPTPVANPSLVIVATAVVPVYLLFRQARLVDPRRGGPL